jgi:hypothetical protein
MIHYDPDGRAVKILRRKMYNSNILFCRLEGTRKGHPWIDEWYIYRCSLSATGGPEEIEVQAKAAPLEPQPVWLPVTEIPRLVEEEQ